MIQDGKKFINSKYYKIPEDASEEEILRIKTEIRKKALDCSCSVA